MAGGNVGALVIKIRKLCNAPRIAPISYLLLVLVVASSVYGAKPVARLKVDIASSHVSVDHATRGGNVLLIGYEQRAGEFSRAIRRVEREGVAAGDGSVQLDLPPGYQIAPHSFWVAIDLASGNYGAVTGDGRKLREGELAGGDIKKDTAGPRKHLVTHFDYVYMLVVRPGVGVWDLASGDGGPLDGDGEVDGKIELPVQQLKKRGTAAQDLDAYEEGDLLFLFVPRQMGYVLAEVPK